MKECSLYKIFDFISHLIDGFYFFCSQLAVSPPKILEFVDSLLKFSLKNKIITNNIIQRFIKNLKKSIRTNTKIYLQRPKVMGDKSKMKSYNPLIYRKFLNKNLIDFNKAGFKIDFKELLVNNMSFGNPIGCLMLIEASLEADDNSFAPFDLNEIFVYLSVFGVVNDSINPVVYRGLSRVFKKISEDPNSGDYCNSKEKVGESVIFDGTLRAEFWASNLYDLSLQITEGKDLLFRSITHYVLKREGFSQSARLIRRLILWASKKEKQSPLEFLYMIQSVNLLHHLNQALIQLENDEEAPLLVTLQNKGSAHLAKEIFNSVIFFINNFMVKSEKFKTEKSLVSFLVNKNYDINQWKGEDVGNGIILLFRSILTKLAKLSDKASDIQTLFIKGREQNISKLVSV